MQIHSRPSLSDSCSLPVGQEISLLWLAGLEPVCLRLVPHSIPFAVCCWQGMGGCFPNSAAPER